MLALASLIGGLSVIALLAVILPLALLLIVLWIWALVHVIKNRRLSDGEKIGWVLAIVFFHVLGSLLYFLFGRRA
jgi:hypothetical protein